MPRNVEIKARVNDLAVLLERIAGISDSGPFEIIQDDTFFFCPNGRLKVREFSPEEGELIFYQRMDIAGPKESSYFISPTSSPASLREILSLALGMFGRVRKRRLLFLTGSTRIHLDEVEGLGHFMELEVILTDGQSVEDGEAIARKVMKQLAIAGEDLLVGAYIDLLIDTSKRPEIPD